MSTFIELIKVGKVKAAFGKKKTALDTVEGELRKIGKLDTESQNKGIPDDP